jgi:hypothetical protein
MKISDIGLRAACWAPMRLGSTLLSALVFSSAQMPIEQSICSISYFAIGLR